MKYLMFSFCLSLLLCSWELNAISIYLSKPIIPLVTTAPDYSIVMEDEVMLVTDTQDPDDDTKVIQVYTTMGNLVLESSACKTQHCRLDLSVLAPGPYLAVLITSKGRIYSQIVPVG